MVGTEAAGLTWRDLDEHHPDLTFREVHTARSAVLGGVAVDVTELLTDVS